jgi:hypothetical protein
MVRGLLMTSRVLSFLLALALPAAGITDSGARGTLTE